MALSLVAYIVRDRLTAPLHLLPMALGDVEAPLQVDGIASSPCESFRHPDKPGQ